MTLSKVAGVGRMPIGDPPSPVRRNPMKPVPPYALAVHRVRLE